jgi:hypothetical protein
MEDDNEMYPEVSIHDEPWSLHRSLGFDDADEFNNYCDEFERGCDA